MTSIAELIEALGGVTATARAIGGISPQAVSNMRARNSVPPEHWPALVDASAVAGIEGITIEKLASMRADRRIAGSRRRAPSHEGAAA